MVDTSKLPISRVDGLDNIVNSLQESVNSVNTTLSNQISKINEQLTIINNKSEIPNWSSPQSINISSYTAPSDGYILLNIGMTDNGNPVILKINNFTYMNRRYGGSYLQGFIPLIFKIGKGQTISLTGALSSDSNGYFIPFLN